MSRMHFFEAIEREIDFQREYAKLEEICAEKYGDIMYGRTFSINTWIEKNFRHWEKRSNYTSFAELRGQLGFSIEDDYGYHCISASGIDLNKYLLFCEMILNVIVGLEDYYEDILADVIEALFKTIEATVEKAGLRIQKVNDELMIVEKSAAAIEVADKQPELANVIIEYNHYLLKGNLERKKVILKTLADALEPKRKLLNALNSRITDDFFYMVNNMNVRHNNSDPNDTKKYNSKFAILSTLDKESWYDIIYEQGLLLFILLEQQGRNNKIEAFKNS